MGLVKPLVLASRSPRRIALLKQIGLVPKVVPSNIEETLDPLTSPVENAIRLSKAKAIDAGGQFTNAVIIGADTIVVLNDMYLGKPVDSADAIRMLELLSGRTHVVVTGFTLLDRPSNRSVTGVEETEVTFRSIPREEIEEYVEGGSPMDKAGAYGIQDDYGAVFVSRINGCYYNVVGLPLSNLYSTLQDFSTQLGKE